MTAEQSYFITLLRDHVHQRPSAMPEAPVDWDTIARYAAEQDLSGIIYYQTREFAQDRTGSSRGREPAPSGSFPEKAARKLKEGFFSNAYLSVNYDYEFEKIAKLFDYKKIEYLPFKGAVLRNYYPHPELRTMGDRDILIRHEDREKSDRIMLSLGYKRYVDNHVVWTYYKEMLMFEIHDVMFYEDLPNQIDYQGYFSRIWDSARRSSDERRDFERIPDPDMHFLYLTAHTAKHITNKGMGFRPFIDMAFFAGNDRDGDSSPDWDRIKAELNKLQLYEFSKTCFSLCEYWFDIEMPFHLERPDRRFMEEATGKIFRDGLFGLDNSENSASASAKKIRRSKNSYGLAAAGIMISKLFPSYRDMQLVPWYSWVDGKPWLLPAAWIYRWFYCLTRKRAASQEILLEPFKKKATIENRDRYLERWGL